MPNPQGLCSYIGPDNVARDESVSNSTLSEAGVYIVSVGINGLDDPSRFLNRWFDVEFFASPRELLRQWDGDARHSLIVAMTSAKKERTGICEVALADLEGIQSWFRVSVSFNRTGMKPRWSFVIIDISKECHSIEMHKAEEEHLRYIVEYNPQLPWIADSSGQIIDFTDRWLQSTGMSREEAVGEGWLNSTHPEDIDHVSGTIARCHETGEPFDVTVRLLVNGEYRWMRARGYPRRDETDNVVCWYGYTEDVHEKVLIDQQIRWDAEHDSLTGLHNRSYLSASLERALNTATAELHKVALLLVDLDNFKDVNDLLGHSAGDELLRKFADFLKSRAPEGAIIARLGGDEFAILLNDLDDESQAIDMAEKIMEVECDLNYGGRTIAYHASMGIGIFPEHGINANQLLRHADLALYRAKSNGRGQFQVFQKEMLDDMHERLAMVNRARTAAKEGRIFAYYQPKICLDTGELAGFESLLRWQDNLGKIHSPDKIFAAFDEKGVAELLGKTMIDHVLNDIQSWKAQSLQFHQVAINVSPVEMRQPLFVDNLIAALEAKNISSKEIEIEITEGVFLGASADSSRRSIERMSNAGIPLALDDFGTGYASLTHLRNLPVSTLKIDRSFVRSMHTAKSDLAIVAAIIAMSKAVGMRVVAEGIEDERHNQILKDLGCDIGQGFYFGKPVPSHEVPALIRGERWSSKENDDMLMKLEWLSNSSFRRVGGSG